jgi:hypothetical protein
MIRQATLQDLPALKELVLVEASRYELVPDKSKIHALLTQGISNKSNFLWVSEEGGKVTGALGALSHQGMWFERKQMTIMLLTVKCRGDGMQLLRTLMRGIKEKRAIRSVICAVDFGDETRIANLLARFGLSKAGSLFQAYN